MTRISDMTHKATLPANAARVPIVIDGDLTNYSYDLAADLAGRTEVADLAASTGPSLIGLSAGVSYGPSTVGAALIPPGSAVADVAVTAGQLVNLYVSGGVTHMQLADGSVQNKPAHAFCPVNVALGATGLWRRRGIIPGTSATAYAADLWLSETVPGSTQSTSPATAGHVSQHVGMVLPGVGIEFNPQPEIEL